MLKFVLVAGLVGTWAAPVKDALVPRQDGSSLEDDILGLSNLDEDPNLWSAFYCEGANYGGQCITQQYSNGECTPIEPPLCENVLSFLATSSNCVLYEGDDCTGSAIPIYSSAQDLQAFRKTNSYRCGLSNAQVAAQLATTPTTPAAHSPAPARRLSLTSTETATVAFTQSFKGTSIVDAHESLHAAAVTSTVEVVPPASESWTSRTDDTPAATARTVASSVAISSGSSTDLHRHHRHPKYVTVTETATRVVVPTETAAPSSVTNDPSHAETREAAPPPTRTTNAEVAATSTPSHHRLPKYVTVTETATRTLDAYVTPSPTLSQQTLDKVSVAPEILTTSTLADAQPLPLANSSVGPSALEASETSHAPANASLSTAPSPTSLIASVHDVADTAVPTTSLPNTLPSPPSASVISHTESTSHPTVGSENTSETPSSTSDSVTHASTGLSSPPEGTEVVSGHQTKPLVGQPKGGSAITGAPEPTQLHDIVPSEASPAVPLPIPSASTTPIAGKQSAAFPSVEHAFTGAVSLDGTPTASVSAKPVGHSETVSNVTPVQTTSSLPTPTPETTERPPSSRAPNNHADALPYSYVAAHETPLTSAVFSPTSALVDDHTSSTVTANATASVEALVSAPSSSDNVAPSTLASTSITPASTEAPIIPPALNTGGSTLHAVVATDQVTEDVKTTVAHQIATPTITSILTAPTRNNEGLRGSHEDGPSHLPVDSSAAIAEVPPTSSSDTLLKESASITTSVHPASMTAFSSPLQGPVDSSTAIENLPLVSSGIILKEPSSVIDSVYAASTTPFSSSLQAPLPVSSPTQFSHVAADASTYYDTASSVLATPSSSSTQAPEREGPATVTTHEVTVPDAPSFTLSDLPSTSTVSYASSPATGASAVAAQIPSPHTSSIHLSVPAAATPPPRSSEDELLATVAVHQVTSLGTASTHVPTSVLADSTPNTSPLVKDEGATSVTIGASSTLSAPTSIGSPAVIGASHVTHDAPSTTSSLSSIPSVASHTDYDGVAYATIDQNIGGYSTPAAQPASAVSPSTSTASETHVPNTPSATEEPASSPATARTTQPEGETVNVTVGHTTLLGPTATSTTAQQVLSTAKVLPIVNPSKSDSTLANDGGGFTSTLPSDKGSIATAYPTPTSTDRIASRPSSLISPFSEVHASDKGPSYATIHKHTSFGSAETSPGSIQATPAPVSHLASHEGHAIDEATAYATVTSSTLITPNSAAPTTITDLSPEALATGKSRHVSNDGADVTSAPMSPEETRTTSITASPTLSAPKISGAPSSRVLKGSIQLNSPTDAAHSTTLLSPVATPISSSISTSTPTAGSTSSEIILTSHPTSSQVLSEGDHESSKVYGGTLGLPTSVYEPILTTTSHTEADLPPVNSAIPTSLPRSHAVDDDSGLVHVTVRPTTGSVPTTTAVSIVSPKVEESEKAGVTSVPSSIASSTASGAPGEGPAYITSRTTDCASATPTGVIPEVSTVSLPSTTAVLAISTQSILQDGTAYATIQQSVTVGATPTTTSGTLASVSSPSHVVNDESLVYVTIHSTTTLGAPLAPLLTSVASVSSGVELPTITPLLASSSVSPTPNPEKESLAYITVHHTSVTTHPSSAVVSHTVDEGVYATAEPPTMTTGPSSTASVTITPSIGTTTAVEVEGPAYVTVHQPSTGSKTIVAENTGDANDIPVLPPTSTPRTSALPYVSAGTASGASVTVTEHIESVKLALSSVGTTPSASASSTGRILSTKKERFTTIRYAGIRTSTPTTSAPYGSTTAAPAEPTGTKTAENTGDPDDILVLRTFASAIPTPPYALASATGTGTIAQVESAAVNPAASIETTATENVTSSMKPATSDRTVVSSGLPGSASTFTSTIIVIPPSRSTGTKTIVTDTTDDSDDIPVLPAASTPSISTTSASFPELGTGVSSTGRVEMTESVALKTATSAGATPTQESSGIVGPTYGYHAITTTPAASFVSSGLPASSSAYTSTYATATTTESTGNKTIAAEGAGDSDDIPILPHLTTPTASPTASLAEPATTTTSIAQNVDDSNDVPVLPHTSSPTVSPLSHPVRVVPVSYTSPVETASPYTSAPTISVTDASLITKTVSLVAHPASSATNPASSPGISSVTTTTSLAASLVESESSAVSSVSEITSKLSSSPAATSTKENQNTPVVTTPTYTPLVATSVEGIHPISSTSESAPATSSSLVAAGTINTQVQSVVKASSSSLQVTYTPASTLLPIATAEESQSTSSLLETTSIPSPSPTPATVEQSSLPPSAETASIQSKFSVLVTVTPASSPLAAAITASSLLEAVSIPVSSSAAPITRSSTVAVTSYSQSTPEKAAPSSPQVTSTSGPTLLPGTLTKVYRSTSSLIPTASTPSSSPILVAAEHSDLSSPVETASGVPISSVLGGTATPASSLGAATGTLSSILEAASIPIPSPTASSAKSSHHASYAVASPSDSQRPTETVSAPSSFPTAAGISINDTIIPVTVEATSSSLQATYTSPPASLPIATTKVGPSTTFLSQTSPIQSSSPPISTGEHSDHPPPIETVSIRPISSVLATAATAPPLSAATASVPSPPETVSIPTPPSAAFSTKSSPVASPSYSQGTLESVSAPSSSPVAAGIIDTQIPTSAGVTSSSLQATYTSASTLLPVDTTVESQSVSSLLQTASAPSSSPTLAAVAHSDPVETVSTPSVSASSVLASATLVSPSGAASVAVPSLLETASIPVSSPASATTERSLHASSAVASPSYSQPLASSASSGAISPTSSTSEAVSTPSSSHIPAAIKDTQSPLVTETATLSVQSTPLVAGSTEPASSPAAATGKEFQITSSVLETASLPTSSVVPTVVEGKQSAPLGTASPAPSAPSTYSAEGIRLTSSVPEAAAAPSSSPSVVTIKDSPSPSPVEVTSCVTHTPTPTSSPFDATKDSQIRSSSPETASAPTSSSIVTSVSHSLHLAPAEATPTQSTSSGLGTAIPVAATPISTSPEATSSPAPAPASASFKDRLASPVSTHVSVPTEATVKDTNSPIATDVQPTLAVLTTPTPSVTTRLDATPAPTHTHHHNHHDDEEEEIVYVTIVTTTTVTEPVCTTTTYPTATVTQTVVIRPGLESVQPTGRANVQ